MGRAIVDKLGAMTLYVDDVRKTELMDLSDQKSGTDLVRLNPQPTE